MSKRHQWLWLSLAWVSWCCAPRPTANVELGASAATTRTTEAAPGPSVLAPRRQPEPQKPLFLWSVNTPHSSAYVLGSIHVAAAELYPLDTRIERAFSECDHLVLETDLDDPRFPEVMARFVEQALLPKGQTVFDTLEPQVAEKLKAKLAELELEARGVEAFQPWFVALTLSLTELSRAGITGDNGIDAHFAKRARGKLPILSLEPLELQLQVLLDMGAVGGMQNIEWVLETEQTAEIRRSLSQWQSGDTEGLARELDKMRLEAPVVYDALFTRRNVGMAREIRTLLAARGRYFVIVGAGHLVGPGNVIELLQRDAPASWTVSQVTREL
jgi:uncharacterized protein YbaP (TraB family)